MQNGDVVRFKTTGYEIADVRNPNPPKEWTGYVIGGPNETHVVLWCKRERREDGAVLIALSNIISVNEREFDASEDPEAAKALTEAINEVIREDK